MTDYTPEYLEGKIKEKLATSYVKAVDESDGCGGKFSVTVVSEQFKGKTLLQKHRLVNAVLSEELKEIHAFSQKCLTPDEWDKVKQE